MTDQINDDIKKNAYFVNRNVSDSSYADYRLPRYLNPYFTDADKELDILDIGCGLGQSLNYLKNKGFKRLYGIDINDESIALCRKKGLSVEKVNDTREFALQSGKKFDRIVMSHVLEHIRKEDMIDTLIHIKKYLLNEGGVFLLMVPNAQSYTGSYWRYEDFTHNILFTAGSCIYVLRAAGFTDIQFIDPDGTRHMNPIKKVFIKALIGYHKLKEDIWNKILQTSFHKGSPRIYTFELKVAAR
ncbi:MAG: class I SAM-dependent methyltransferase [Sphingobacteriales bacterium]|nr:class I SAM-dependent methyltransferase [Sphingobacteriales bacterium]